MGFASAFASGLIKGFNQNILREQEARAKEEQKLDAYEAMIFKTAMEGGDDVNVDAINKISGIVKSGRKQLEDRGGIDIFGRPSERLKLDMLNTAGIVNNTNNTYKIGSVNMPVVKAFYDKTTRTDPSKRASTFFDSLNRLGKDKVNQLFKSKEDKAALSQVYMNNVKNYLRPQVLQDGKIVQILGPDSIDVHGFMKDIVSIDKSNYQIALENLGVQNEYKQGDFILPLRGQNAVLTNFKDMNFNPKQQQSLKGLASLHGFEDAGEFIYTAASKYENKSKFISSLGTTIELYEMNAHQPKSNEEMRKIGAYLVEKGVDKDPLAAAYIMAPLIHNPDNVRLDKLRELGFKEALQTGDYKTQFNKFTGMTLEKFETNYSNLTRTDFQLKKLVSYMQQAKLKPGSTIQTLYSSFNSIFNKGGSLDQIKDLIGIDVTSDEGKAIARRISASTQGLDEGSLQAKIATLKFVIAADLARAEDSQGRLSDQDLARNLAKLGDKTYTTIPGAIKAIEEIQDDIKYKLDSVKTLNQIKERARGRQYFTSDERRLLQANNLARTYISEYNRSTFSGGYVEEQISFTAEDVMNPDKFDAPDPNLQGSGGETVHRSKDGKSYVLLSRDGKSIEKQIPADSIGQAVDDRSITYTEVGGIDDVKGMLSPFGPDANPNVAPSTSGGGTTPPITVPSPPPAVVTEVLGTDIGISNISDLGQADANGFYTVNGTKYKVTKFPPQNPLTLTKVSP
jgi:hypothetical protein